MSNHIPDLWPKGLSATVLSPRAILKAQGTKLAERTKGLLEGEVSTSGGLKEGKPGVILELDIVAPVLNNYRHRVLTAWHAHDMFYPAYIQRAGGDSWEIPAATEEKFVEEVGKVLQSPAIASVLDSLLARSNEAEEAKQAG